LSSVSRMFAPLGEAQSYRTLLFLLYPVPLGALGATVLIAGWTVALVFCSTPLIVPILIGFRAAVGWIAVTEAAVARTLLGIPVRARSSTPASHGRPGSRCS
jgi:hypothetical protein